MSLRRQHKYCKSLSFAVKTLNDKNFEKLSNKAVIQVKDVHKPKIYCLVQNMSDSNNTWHTHIIYVPSKRN